MKKGLFLFAVLVLGVLLASCKTDEGHLNESPNLIFNPKGPQTVVLDATAETYAYDIKISRTMAKERALTINLAVDQAKLPSGKTLLNAGYYSFDKTVTMDANVGQVTFTVTFRPEFMFESEPDEENWSIYSLPIKISGVTPEIPLSEDDTYVVINTTLRGASIISEGATEYAEVFSGGENAVVTLTATANFSADASKVSYTADADGVAAFNTENGTNLPLLANSAYSIGTGKWDVLDVTDEEGTIIDVIDVIANEITVNASLAKGQYILPLKVTTSEDGINIDQMEPIYILVESFGTMTAATVMNGNFESTLPLDLTLGYWYYPEDIMKMTPGVWRWKWEWQSSAGTDDDGPTYDAEINVSTNGTGLTGKCLVIDCSTGTCDYIITQKITGLNPSKMYKLSAKAKVSDITKTRSNGVRIGCWKKDNTEFWGSNANWSEKTLSESWTDLTLNITSINDDGTALIALRFGGSSADTDGKAYFDDVKIEEFIPETTGGLINGDFEEAVTVDVSKAVSLGSGDAGTTTNLLALDPGKMILANGWAITNADITQETTGAHSGSKCIKIFGARGKVDGGYVQRITGLTPGDVYTFTGWAKSENITARSYPRHEDLTGPGYYPKEEGAHLVWWKYKDASTDFAARPESSECVRNVGTWTEMTLEVTVPSTGEVFIGARMGGGNSDMDGTCWFDDLKFVKKP